MKVLAALLVVGLIAAAAYLLLQKPAAPTSASATCAPPPVYFTAKATPGVFISDPPNYFCPHSQLGPTSWCALAPEDAEAYCAADPSCNGYFVPANAGWGGLNPGVGGNMGSVLLAGANSTSPNANFPLATFYQKVPPAAA